MILEQHYLACLAQASYLIVDERTHTAVVVDPRRDVQLYLHRAHELGAKITHVLLTHFHADFASGHLELAQKTGAQILLGAAAHPEYPHHSLADGETLDLGDVRIEARATPGHTPESTCYVIHDLTSNNTHPHAILTGDTLFIGDVGRPDLMSSVGVTAEDLAANLYDSLHDKVMSLPDETLLYPGHGAGSMCGKNLSTDTVSTIGAQRQLNYAVQPMSKQAFVNLVTAGQPEAPAYFGYDAAFNKRDHKTLDANLEETLKPLSLERVLELAAAGARIVDTRDAMEFAQAHLAGSTNIGLDGKFATWAGTLLDAEGAIVIVAAPEQEHEVAVRLGRVGMDNVLGYLKGGFGAASRRTQLHTATRRITPTDLAAALQADDDLLVLDVRQPGEWEAGHVEDALHIPLPQLERRIHEVPTDREIAVMCKAGYRSSTAASLMARHGISSVQDMIGGFDAWVEAGLPVTAPVAAS